MILKLLLRFIAVGFLYKWLDGRSGQPVGRMTRLLSTLAFMMGPRRFMLRLLFGLFNSARR